MRINGRSGFVHLHVHSSYSLLEGALTIPRLAELARADRQPALALTDTDNMFGALEFSDKIASVGIQPIVGCAVAVDFARSGMARAPAAPTHPRIVLLAAHEAGYRNLMRLSSRAFLETPSSEKPHIKLAWLDGATDGLIALTGGPCGPLDTAIAAGQSELAARPLRGLLRLFGDRLYIELQRHGMPAERSGEPSSPGSPTPKGFRLVQRNEAFFARARGLRGPRRADLHRRGAVWRENRPPATDPRASVQDPRRNGGAVRRPAGGARVDG